MAINGLFVRTDPQRRRYGVALLVGVLSGIISAFVNLFLACYNYLLPFTNTIYNDTNSFAIMLTVSFSDFFSIANSNS